MLFPNMVTESSGMIDNTAANYRPQCRVHIPQAALLQ